MRFNKHSTLKRHVCLVICMSDHYLYTLHWLTDVLEAFLRDNQYAWCLTLSTWLTGRSDRKIFDQGTRFICLLIFICCYWCCDLYKFIYIKDTAGQSANEDPKSILATYPKSAGGPILCAEASVTSVHPGLSYLSRSSNMVQALRIPAWGFSEFLWSHFCGPSWHRTGPASPATLFQIKLLPLFISCRICKQLLNDKLFKSTSSTDLQIILQPNIGTTTRH